MMPVIGEYLRLCHYLLYLFLDNLDFRPIVAPFGRTVTFVESSGSLNTIRRQCVEITLFPDELYEDNECFFVDLTFREGVISPPVTKVIILDDEGLYFRRSYLPLFECC